MQSARQLQSRVAAAAAIAATIAIVAAAEIHCARCVEGLKLLKILNEDLLVQELNC